MPKYIHQNKDYPKFSWDRDVILNLLTNVSVKQGRILGKMQQFGYGEQHEVMLNALTEEITKSSEIEGEILNSEQVRSSLARRLNVNLENETTPSHFIEGVVDAAYITRRLLRNWFRGKCRNFFAGLMPMGMKTLY